MIALRCPDFSWAAGILAPPHAPDNFTAGERYVPLPLQKSTVSPLGIDNGHAMKSHARITRRSEKPRRSRRPTHGPQSATSNDADRVARERPERKKFHERSKAALEWVRLCVSVQPEDLTMEIFFRLVNTTRFNHVRR